MSFIGKLKDSICWHLKDMHLYHTSRESGIRFAVACLSVGIGILLPILREDTDIETVNAACFIFSASLFTDVLLSIESRKYVFSRIISFLFFLACIYTITSSMAQIIARVQLSVLPVQPYIVVVGLLAVQLLDTFIHMVIGATMKEELETGGAEKQYQQIYKENAFEGKLGKVDQRK